jgi:hypothetical protein
MYGAPYGNRYGLDSGAAYVVFGHSGTFNDTLDLFAVDGSNGFRIDGSGNYDNAGYVVRSLEDINGDGFADIFVGGFREVSVFLGHNGTFAAKIDLSSANGSNGFSLNYSGDIANAGDINGDGYVDLTSV